jgi:hypothetical protein
MGANDNNGSEKIIELRGSVRVKELAALLGLKLTHLVMDFIGLKVLVNMEGSVPFDLAAKVAQNYGFHVKRVA